MEKKSFMIILVFLFIFGLFLGTLGNSLTGNAIITYKAFGLNELQQIRGSNPITIIRIENTTIPAGGYLRLEVDPGIRGARKDLRIYEVNEEGYGIVKKGDGKALISNVCSQGFSSGFKCFDTVKVRPIRTESDWRPGLYAVKMFDYYLNDYVSAEFTIEYTKPKGFT